ncbi:MAG: PcfJ domain-containing protein, partial [Bacteroidota bacterium]
MMPTFLLVVLYLIVFAFILRRQYKRFLREEIAQKQRARQIIPEYQKAYRAWKKHPYFGDQDAAYLSSQADQDLNLFYLEWKEQIRSNQTFFMAFMGALVQNEAWLNHFAKDKRNYELSSFVWALEALLPPDRYEELSSYPPEGKEAISEYAVRLVKLIFEKEEVPQGIRNIWLTWNYPANLMLYNYGRPNEDPAITGEIKPQDHILFKLYFFVAEGNNPRAFTGLPFQFSKRQVEWLKKMPPRMTLSGGYWWMVYRGAGGDPNYAMHVASLPLDFGELRFWQDFVRLLAQESESRLDSDQLWELIQMVQFVKFGTGTFSHHPEVTAHQKSQPQFSWKGKKLAKLYHDLDILFCPRYKEPTDLALNYTFSYVDHQYEVVWLDTRRALSEEGEIMDHCVGDYHWECVEGESVIFSLRKKQEDQRDWSELTIELGKNGDRYFVNQAL